MKPGTTRIKHYVGTLLAILLLLLGHAATAQSASHNISFSFVTGSSTDVIWTDQCQFTNVPSGSTGQLYATLYLNLRDLNGNILGKVKCRPGSGSYTAGNFPQNLPASTTWTFSRTGTLATAGPGYANVHDAVYGLYAISNPNSILPAGTYYIEWEADITAMINYSDGTVDQFYGLGAKFVTFYTVTR